MDSLTAISSALPIDGVSRVEARGRGSADPVQIAKDFESLLLTKVVEEMAKTVEESGEEDDAAGQQVRDMFYNNLAQELSAKGGFGLWKQIARQLAPKAQAGQQGQEVAP